MKKEDADLIVHVATTDQEPGLKQFKEELADCVARHNEKLILQRADVKEFIDNEIELLKGSLIDVRNNKKKVTPNLNNEEKKGQSNHN